MYKTSWRLKTPLAPCRRAALAFTLVVTGALIGFTPAARAQSNPMVIKQWYHQYGEQGTQDAVQRYADEYNQLHPM